MRAIGPRRQPRAKGRPLPDTGAVPGRRVVGVQPVPWTEVRVSGRREPEPGDDP